jgi:hypothetical protein
MIVSRRRSINQRASGRILPSQCIQNPFRRVSVKESTFFADFPMQRQRDVAQPAGESSRHRMADRRGR